MIPSAVPGDHHTTTAALRNYVRDLTTLATRAEGELFEELGGLAIALSMTANDIDTAEQKLRAELADTAMMRDFHARSAAHLAGKRDNAEAAIAAWEQGRSTGYDALLRIKTALAAPAVVCTCGAEAAHQHGCQASQ